MAMPKPNPSFVWSYSKLKNYEVCPKRHYNIDIAKTFKEDESDQLKWGNEVHKALAARIAHGKQLPKSMEAYEDWVLKVTKGDAKTLVEQKLALREDFSPCGYFDSKVWYRGVADVLRITDRVATAIDWKTGKILEDSVQLALMAACVLAAYPSVQVVRTAFVWLAEDCKTTEDYNRESISKMWRHIWPRIEALKSANLSQDFPPKPGHLCRKWCPVTSCPHHGV